MLKHFMVISDRYYRGERGIYISFISGDIAYCLLFVYVSTSIPVRARIKNISGNAIYCLRGRGKICKASQRSCCKSGNHSDYCVPFLL